LNSADYLLHFLQPRSSVELKSFVSELENLQVDSPELKVVIFGGVPKGRVAAFLHKTGNGFMSYVIPYPEVIPQRSNFNR
jgi:hypothetical protein